MAITRDQFNTHCHNIACIYLEKLNSREKDIYIQSVCKNLDSDDLHRREKLREILARKYYSIYDFKILCNTDEIAKKIYTDQDKLGSMTNWVSSATCFELLANMLRNESVIDRTIVAFKLSNQKSCAIANCLNEAIGLIVERLDTVYYPEIHFVITEFQEKLEEASSNFLQDEFTELISYKDNLEGYMKTLKQLSRLIKHEEGKRYLRGNDGVRSIYGWINERYRTTLNTIRSATKIDDFVISEDHEP